MGDPSKGTYDAYKFTQKRARQGTQLRDMTLCYTENELIVIDFDDLGNPIGEVGMQFKSFVATQAKNHFRIVYKDWDNEKRQKGKEIQKKLVAEKVKQVELEGVEVDPSLVDITHHDLWKRA
ncbi:hypothetical protein CR513_55748, partial [Mucuna pruriens]